MKIPRWLTPVSAISVFFIAVLFSLTLCFYGDIPGAGALAARYAGAAIVVVLASWARSRWPGNAVIRYIDFFMPLFIVLFTFDSLSHLTHYINPVDKDPKLAALDAHILGTDVPGRPFDRFINPILTTVLQLCYTSYYFLPVLFCLILFLNGGESYRLKVSIFGVVLGFFVSYVGYLVVPALGPRFYFHGMYGSGLMRGPVAVSINNTLNILEGENRDAFPSGHTELVLIVLFFAWRYKRWFFWTALPLVCGLILATVYLRYHYVIDVIAGMVIAPLCIFCAYRIYDLLVRMSGGPGPASQPRRQAGP
ncbi:MAG: phosphatase PAP2 family protein [Nitrospirota bacterium]